MPVLDEINGLQCCASSGGAPAGSIVVALAVCLPTRQRAAQGNP
jgi:hypothetical protein